VSGRVEMILPDNTDGFDASLSSYQGIIESDFKLKTTQPRIEGQHGRKMIGRFGTGKSQISLIRSTVWCGYQRCRPATWKVVNKKNSLTYLPEPK
jgi:hypothetical protein